MLKNSLILMYFSGPSHSTLLRNVRTWRYWIVTFLFSLPILFGGLIELMIRRDTTASLYLFNKAVASTAFLMIALSFVLSAIHQFWGPFRQILPYRRYAGLIGYGYAVLHIILVFLIKDPQHAQAAKFPFPDFFLQNSLSIIFALAGFLIFSWLVTLSINTQKRFGTPAKSKKWRSMLRCGYFGVLMVFIHATLLKYEGWVSWATTLNPILPPLSLIVAVIGTCMILFKIAQLAKVKRLL